LIKKTMVGCFFLFSAVAALALLPGGSIPTAAAGATAEGTRPGPVYPPMTFPRANDGTFGAGCQSWDCVSFTSCYWLQYVANKTGAPSLAAARATVVAALDTVPEASWTSFLVPPDVMAQLKENITESACELDVASYPTLPYHDWKTSEDGPNAAPLNHKVLAETDALRVVNVYGYPGSTEAMHSHKWMSIFLQWGEASGLCIRQYNATGGVVHDSYPCLQTAPPYASPRALQGLFWLPQYLHGNYYYPQTNFPRNANCPLDRSPGKCDGFFIRVELKLNESLDGMSW
jgi:hypothetical protein